MYKVFEGVIKTVRASKNKLIDIDNLVAKCHYRITCWLLLVFSCLVTYRQYFGEYIQCIHGISRADRVINTFCFCMSTYTVIHNDNDSNVKFMYTGVSSHMESERIVRHAYYQWVPFVLFGQALLFYMPHLIWKTCENETVRKMVTGLQRLYLKSSGEIDVKIENFRICSKKTLSKNTRKLCAGFRLRMRINRWWAYKLIFCECLYLFNLLTQIYAMDAFLGDNFISLGKRLWVGRNDDNPLEIVFPKMTKCDFHKYGPSGTIQTHDALCVMSLNVINEKLYTILWFWFVILTPITILVLIWRASSFVLYRCKIFNWIMLAFVPSAISLLDSEDVDIFTNQSCYSDWLLLYYLGSNMDPYVFIRFLRNLEDIDDEDRRRKSDSDVDYLSDTEDLCL